MWCRLVPSQGILITYLHARQVSLARSEGRPILPPERDDEQRELTEQQQAVLVDAFLAWDFDMSSAATFFSEQGARIQQLNVAAR